MSLRNDLARVVARDPRYSIQAYALVREAIEYTERIRKRRRAVRSRRGGKAAAAAAAQNITGRELCEGFRRLVLAQYGLMALAVLNRWGLRSTADIGAIVYNLIASGDVEETPSDSRADFDNVFDFETAFRREFVVRLDELS
jgi:uncharacterized repeat protein (TIGR04138 family)